LLQGKRLLRGMLCLEKMGTMVFILMGSTWGRRRLGEDFSCFMKSFWGDVEEWEEQMSFIND
jgi:hypothetical protein